MKDINTINPSIQFTLTHTTLPSAMNNLTKGCTCERITSLPFLDTSLSIQDGKVHVDLYRKPTEINQYLLTSSCHPAHVTKNIPFSLALRIVRICSNHDHRLDELKQLLVSRGYKAGMVNDARNIPRQEALKMC
jgi:hypothetical protein